MLLISQLITKDDNCHAHSAHIHHLQEFTEGIRKSKPIIMTQVLQEVKAHLSEVVQMHDTAHHFVEESPGSRNPLCTSHPSLHRYFVQLSEDRAVFPKQSNTFH